MESTTKTVVIVGSGLGGLICGAILSMEGYAVTVLERNKQFGGNLQSFARDKHLFDSGVHYIGGLEPGQNMHRIFKYLGIIDKLKLEKLDEAAFDKIVLADDAREFNYAQGYDRFINTLAAEFPEERPAIEAYCAEIQRICDAFPLYRLQPATPGPPADAGALSRDTQAFIASLTDNVKLQNVLAGNNPLYAGMRDKTPLYVHALVLNSYIESAYRIVDGGGQIAKFLASIIRRHGGQLLNRVDVTRFVVADGAVRHVACADGREFAADLFISNVHPAQTYEMTDTELIRPVFRRRVLSLENSLSAFVINATLKPGTFPYRRSNYYCYLNDDVWTSMDYTEATWPLSYSLFYSGTSRNKEFAEGISILAYMKFEEVAEWQDTLNTARTPTERGNGYEEFKQRKAEALLEKVYLRFPELRDAIKSYYTATPLTFRDYMGTADGAIYGIAKDYTDPLRTFISHRTKLPNLLLTGQNVNMHGVLGVAISALVTCSELVGLPYLLQKIDDAQNS
ncbi:NAD(P)/FAD-dependent oxidoreductase [Hymenobacter sp. DH14]|uniref:NAD(P)/FAD-dependent oxidoreductase n=1 Tax=Hymenobacter cyanobacteriorum TaxID=2926463 RepID=A0A9X1VDZ9_9BACT|nr:NAD(P)/FAD-dependent oxidoreductase [Hymenobacter cyanobacteriorum]MCI1186392.1 NAD(P)/FAD-dependent oxidoreductase [Hymenobacter cyanobacteriorum]